MSHATTGEPTLEDLREEIQTIDRQIVARIAQRTYVGEGVAAAKERRDFPTVDEDRERAVTDAAGETAAEFDLDENLVRAVFQLCIELSKVRQRGDR